MTENQDLKVPVYKSSGRLFAARTVSDVYALTGKVSKKSKETTVKADPAAESYEYASWGSNNKWPTDFRKKMKKIPVATRAMNKLIRMDYGNGLVYFNNEDLQKGSKVKRAYKEEVEAFLKRNRIEDRFLPSEISNRRWTANNFGEFILNQALTEIIQVRSFNSEFCRTSKQDPKTLSRDWIYYSEYFINGMATTDLTALVLQLPQFEQEEFIKEHKTFGKFAYHNYLPDTGMTYYATHPAESLTRDEGYADVSIAVPEIINRMMNNQVSLAYMITIPISYFVSRHPGFETMSDEKKGKLFQEKIDDLNSKLSDPKNKYKSISTIVDDTNPQFAQAPQSIKIEAIDDKIKKGEWIPTASIADTQIAHGVGLHPSLIGLANDGGSLGAGSGSDQRESHNSEIDLNTLDQMSILWPLNFIAQFNKWNVTFMIDNTSHTTSNLVESGLVNSPHKTEVIDE